MKVKTKQEIIDFLQPIAEREGVELVDVEDSKVYVKLRGACASCKNAMVTLKYFVENTLRDHISPDIEVVEV